MAHKREVNSFAPKYSEGEKEMNLQLFARTPETTKAISALVPKTLNGVKGFSMPLMSMMYIRNARASIAQPPA